MQTILDGGALAARKRAAQAGLEQADAQYRSTVLTAFRNVADVLRALEYDALALKAAVDAERAAATSREHQPPPARARRHHLQRRAAERAHLPAGAAQPRAGAGCRFTDTAALFQALGGGWWNRDAVADRPPPVAAVRHRPLPAPNRLRSRRADADCHRLPTGVAVDGCSRANVLRPSCHSARTPLPSRNISGDRPDRRGSHRSHSGVDRLDADGTRVSGQGVHEFHRHSPLKKHLIEGPGLKYRMPSGFQAQER